jgi:hypothetical protein
MNDEFWINNPSILFRNNKILDIFINKTNNFNENMNATTRLLFYLTIVVYLVNKNNKILFIGLGLIVAIIALYFITKHKQLNVKQQVKEGFKNQLKEINEKYTLPQSNNPMMNVLLPEIKYNPKRPAAAPSFNPEIEEDINNNVKNNSLNELTKENDNKTNSMDKVNSKLFKDAGDNMEFDFSMRQFYTTPNSEVANNQKAFAEFCYGDMISCKEPSEQGLACLKNMPPRWTNY